MLLGAHRFMPQSRIDLRMRYVAFAKPDADP